MKIRNIQLQLILWSSYTIASHVTEDYSRIINGVEVQPPFIYPWMAAIRMHGGPYCGGVFVTKDVMITAAHCSKIGTNDDFRVLAHRHDLRKTSKAEEGFSLHVIKRLVHPEHDIAIWHLENKHDFKLSQAIHLPSLGSNLYEGGTLATALGWGWLKTGGPGSNSLQQVDVPLVDNPKCLKIWYRRGVNLDLETQVCAGWPMGKKGNKILPTCLVIRFLDTCKGDSGGPLFIKSKDGTPILIGLTSFGDPCAKANVPTVYIRISYFTDWIQEKLISFNVTIPSNTSSILILKPPMLI